MRCTFLAVLNHKLIVIFHISTYSKWEFSKPNDTSVENVMLCGFTELAELNYLCIYTIYYFGRYWRIYKYYPKTTLAGGTLRPVGMGASKWFGNFRITSWEESLLPKEYFFLENIYIP